MSATRRQFLITGAAITGASAAFVQPELSALDGQAIAAGHRIVRAGATPDFFEGMLLGNGDIGLCITVRPDALELHIGKSDSWDIRVSEEHDQHILKFRDLLALWQKASEEAKRRGLSPATRLEEAIPSLREYTDTVTASYKKTWPRPWPCGIIRVHWDPTHVEILDQTLDPSNGRYQLRLNASGQPVTIFAFVNTTSEHVCVWSDQPGHFAAVTYDPYRDVEAQLPDPEIGCKTLNDRAELSGHQRFPALAPTHDQPHPPSTNQDKNFSLLAIVNGQWEQAEHEDSSRIVLRSRTTQPLRLDAIVATPRDHGQTAEFARSEAARFHSSTPQAIQQSSDRYWSEYWNRSAIQIEDKELERWWYHNQYWLACCLRAGKLAPGLFGNWTSGKYGTAWHGDYHMNYNTQQVFWGVFSSNHVEQNLPYVDLLEGLLPMSTRYAREKFELPGAYFPHSAYPVPSQVVPYPAPPWGYEICETPWAVQSLWWHYRYTSDEAILRRVYPTLKAAAQFIAAYVKRGNDGKYHVDPTVSPENWGCTIDFRLNRDCIMDLALIDFLLEAVAEGSQVLGVDAAEREHWVAIRKNIAPYPTARAAEGEVWLDVPNAPTGWIYNVPVTLAPVFPGERVGLHSSPAELELARRTAKSIRLEGGNDVVYQPLIRARLGMLDLDWFKREVRYCLMPNGIVQDRVRQTGGRYHDSTNFDFMMRMGVWTENLSLPVVLNECFLQSYSGVLHLFPNTIGLKPARFQNLRAVGAFLVSAAWDGSAITSVSIYSERGNKVRLRAPWPASKMRVMSGARQVPVREVENVFEFDTAATQLYQLSNEGI